MANNLFDLEVKVNQMNPMNEEVAAYTNSCYTSSCYTSSCYTSSCYSTSCYYTIGQGC